MQTKQEARATAAVRAAKINNREANEAERLAANRSRSAPDARRETRQQVRAEGRVLEQLLAARQQMERRAEIAAKRPRKTASSEMLREAVKNATGWLKCHDFGLGLVTKRKFRDEREAKREEQRKVREAAEKRRVADLIRRRLNR